MSRIRANGPLTIAQQKKALRIAARDRRAAAHAAQGDTAGEMIRAVFLDVPGLAMQAGAVSGYWPMRGEADPLPLLTHLHKIGVDCGLPVVEAQGRPLTFRRWRPGMDLEPGSYGERIPGPDVAAVTPSTLLVPLLAFDRAGYRLGYGGGYYDRTIAHLRSVGPIVAVGVAFAAQEVESVPHDRTDQRLDWVITESEAIRITA